MKVHGQCHCGAIRYEAEVDPARAQACHCTDCQRLSGSPYRVSVPAPRESFVLLSGNPRIYVKTADSGNKRAQAFCPECGSPVYSAAPTDPQAYMLRVGTIRQRKQLQPKAQQWCRSALDWAMDLSSVPRFDKQQTN